MVPPDTELLCSHFAVADGRNKGWRGCFKNEHAIHVMIIMMMMGRRLPAADLRGEVILIGDF